MYSFSVKLAFRALIILISALLIGLAAIGCSRAQADTTSKIGDVPPEAPPTTTELNGDGSSHSIGAGATLDMGGKH